MRRPAMFVIGLVVATGSSLALAAPASAAGAGANDKSSWCHRHHRYYHHHHHGYWNHSRCWDRDWDRDWDDDGGHWNNKTDSIELHIVGGPTGALN